MDRGSVPDEPDSTTSPPAPRGAAGPAGNNRVVRAVLLATLALLVSLVIAVFWVLPRHVGPADDPAFREDAAVPPGPAAPSRPEIERARQKREAERALEAFLKLQAVLESREVAVWAAAEYEEALQTLARADEDFAGGHFDAAGTRYEQAARRLEALQGSTAERLAAALTRGAAALDRYDGGAAEREFRMALAMDPDNEQARQGAARAGSVEAVLRLLDEAAQAEAQGELASARALLESAVALDPLAPRPGAELARISAAIEDQRFKALMSQALAAIEGGRFDAAAEALKAASALRSGSAEVADARVRLRQAIDAAKIAAHRRRAADYASAERWHQAAGEFQAVLAIDAQAQFALQGLAQSRRLASLHDQLDAWLRDPERLQSAQPRENARTLLGTVSPGPGDGPRLGQKLDQLATLLRQAETPVDVELLSDGLTDVAIDRVGRFGRFKRMSVALLPGRYVVRGERAGYRDVRLEIRVGPGSATPPLEVKCEEKV